DASANQEEVPSRLPEVVQQERFVLCPQIQGSEDPELFHPRCSGRSDAVKSFYWERLDKTRPHRGRDDVQAIRLAIVGGQLGQEFVVRDACGCRQLSLDVDFCPNLFGDLCRGRNTAKIFGDIEISFIERQRLDNGSVLREYRADLQ